MSLMTQPGCHCENRSANTRNGFYRIYLWWKGSTFSFDALRMFGSSSLLLTQILETGETVSLWVKLFTCSRVEHQRRERLTAKLNCLGLSNIQLQSAALKPRALIFPISFTGEIVLNAELKSTNSLLMWPFLFPRCAEPEWRSSGYGVFWVFLSFERLLVSVQAGRDVVFHVLRNQFLKTLHQDVDESHRAWTDMRVLTILSSNKLIKNIFSEKSIYSFKMQKKKKKKKQIRAD